VLAIVLVGCSSGPTTPEKTCLDTAEAAAKAGERCGFNKQQTYDNFIREAAAGSCSNVTAIRDEHALRTTCFSWLDATPCENIYGYGFGGNSRLDPSCQNQLIRGFVDGGRD
jgi:hypothetical protein